MSIIFVTPSLKTGGGNRVFVALANELARDKNRNIFIVAPYNSADRHTFDLSESVSVSLIGKLARGKFAKVINVIKTLRYLSRRHCNDTIIATDPIFSIFLPFIRCKHIFRFIQADDYRIFDDGSVLGAGLLLKAYKKLCLISYRYQRIQFIFNSKYVYRQFCQDSRRNDIPLTLVHPALCHEVFNPSMRKDQANTKPNICLVARKHPLKGIINFINVWRHLPIEIKGQAGQVVLVSHDDLSCFDTSGMIIVQPKSDTDIAHAYCDSHIFISTSWWEGFGLPPLEAMACGCATICSQAGGVEEYTVANENCLMFAPRDEEQLSKCLIRLIGDVALRNQLGEQGMHRAQKFTWAYSTKQLLKAIEQ